MGCGQHECRRTCIGVHHAVCRRIVAGVFRIDATHSGNVDVDYDERHNADCYRLTVFAGFVGFVPVHRFVSDVFVPDEECGLRGAKKMDFSKFPVAFAYTIDCCELGEVVYETFNAGSAVVKIKGVSAHPMSAKGVMVNPTLVAVDLINSFDRMQTPEHTEGTEGYIWAKSIISNQSEAVVQLDIRDHNKNTYEARKHLIKTNVESLQKLYPRAEIVCTITDTYGNIADAVNDENRKCIDYIYTAMSELGIKPNTIAMRGGTDGSYISTQGILTPNYFTGGHNFHSNCEFLPLLALEKSCQMTLKLIELIAKG